MVSLDTTVDYEKGSLYCVLLLTVSRGFLLDG